MLSWAQGKVWAYVFFGVALIILLLGTLGIMPMETSVLIAGIVGFPAGLASLRAYIDSSGAKTYIVVGLFILNGVLILFQVIPYDTGLKVYSFIVSVAGITLTQAQTKALNPK